MAKKYKTLKDKIFEYEKQIYDLEQMIDISRSFSSTLDSTTLLESIVFSCMAQLHVVDAGIFVLDFLTSDNLILKTKQNLISADSDQECKIPFSDPAITFLANEKRPLTIEYLGKKYPKSNAVAVLRSLKPTLIIPLIQKNHLNGLLFLGERFMIDAEEETGYTEYEKNLVSTIASLSSIAINNATLIERSSTDMMTQLKLKYFFFNALSEKLDIAMNQKLPLSVIMFDIDFFKHFNDTYGHECGDYVLKQVAALIKENMRETDLASRYGGEEFTVMLNDTEKDEAIAVAERIRSCIEEYDFVFNDQHMHVTISCGVAVFNYETNPITLAKQLVNQADQGLYMSKHNGRNRVTYAHPSLVALDEEENKD